MRILHLGYEDPAQPGSGGGSVRTWEINRRLSAEHEITVLVAGYPGARPRVEEGVRWEPLWPRTGHKVDRLAYFALLGPAILSHPHDLLVEDFGAPFGPGLSPLYTRRPVVASVQWLFAQQMREKYRLPFDKVQRWGMKMYGEFIVVSEWLGGTFAASDTRGKGSRHPQWDRARRVRRPNDRSPASDVSRSTGLPPKRLRLARKDSGPYPTTARRPHAPGVDSG